MDDITAFGAEDESGASEAAKGALGMVADLAVGEGSLDPSKLDLGTALRSFFVQPALLKRLAKQHDLTELSNGSDGMMFPVRDGAEVVSSVTVKPGPTGWKVDAVGSANLMRDITDIRDADVSTSGTEPRSYFVVAIPILHLSLLGRVGEDGWKMRSIYQAPDLETEPEQWAPAPEILDRAARLLPEQ